MRADPGRCSRRVLAIVARASRGWVLVALALTGCTHAVLRPAFPDDAPPREVKPFHTYVDAVQAGEHVVVKTFLVHGMTHSDSNWADTFIQKFAERLKVTVPLCTRDHEIAIAASPWADGAAQLCVVSGSAGDVDYVFYALQWAPLTDPYKCTEPMLSDRGADAPILSADKPDETGRPGPLCGETSLAFPKRRAAINGAIKNGVLDDGFPDVIVYLAPNFQPVFWRVVSEGLCRMYSDDPRTTACVLPANSSVRCGADVPAPTANQRYVFVTHSLGANILLDTLAANLDCEKQTPSVFGVKLESAIRTTFSGPTPFYMLANQYVLLQLHKATENDFRSSHPTAAQATSPPVFDIRRHPFFEELAKRPSAQSRGPQAGRPKLQIDLVAFSDPNDDLTYLLPSRPPPIGGITVQNVLVRDAAEYLFVFEDPTGAHVNYFRKPDEGRILDVIFCGMDAGGVLPC